MTVSIENQHRTAFTIVGLTVILVVCLAPFADKAFHIDDPLFIWTARQIQEHPFDFYDFTINWYGYDMPMSEITKNPPLASYYIAAVASLFGWNEIPLHLAFLIPALGAVLGTYFLAKHFCLKPALAALAGMLTPVFLVSSTTLMCDTMMLFFWVWAVALWIRGMRRNESFTLFLAVLMISFSALTKYYGICLIPLLFIYSLAQRRRLGRWALFFVIPILILVLYHWLTYILYGRGLLFDAVSSVVRWKSSDEIGLISKGLIGLSFIGGCLASAFFYSPLLWSRRVLAGGIALLLLLIVSLSMVTIDSCSLHNANGVKWNLVFQLGLFIIAGLNVLVLSILDFFEYRDAKSLLLFLWMIGTFVFATFINWTINGRSILPMAPALGILLVRRVSRQRTYPPLEGRWHMIWPLIPAAFIAILVTWADYGLANTTRKAVEVIHEKYKNIAGTIWFQGHWGFQYYMEAAGSKPIDLTHSYIAQEDIAILPLTNTAVYPMPPKSCRVIHKLRLGSSQWLTTMNLSTGASFYAASWGGPFPYAISNAPPERYHVFLFSHPTLFNYNILE